MILWYDYSKGTIALVIQMCIRDSSRDSGYLPGVGVTGGTDGPLDCGAEPVFRKTGFLSWIKKQLKTKNRTNGARIQKIMGTVIPIVK